MLVNEALKESIWLLVASIPEGKVLSYGELARRAGYPSHARYVGSVLKKLPKDTELPWHRVINASGKISFPELSTAYKVQMQKLEAEGVVFKAGRCNLKVYLWQ